MKFRASQLDQIAACPASWKETAGLVPLDSQPARDGRGGHEVIRFRIENKRGPTGLEMGEIALRTGASRAQIEIADHMAMALGDILVRPGVKCEIEVQTTILGHVITGHIDAGEPLDPSGFAFFDWKFGRVEAETSAQQAVYAVAVSEKYDFPVDANVWQPRLRLWKTAIYESEEDILPLRRGLEAVIREATAESPRYNPGEACQYCPALGTCPAVHRELLPVVAELPNLPALIRGLSLEDAGRLRIRIALLQEIVDEAMKQLRVLAAMRGGLPTDHPDKIWGPVETLRETIIITTESFRALKDAVGADALAEVLKVGKTALKEIVMTNTPKGQKRAAWANLMDILDGLGAVERKKETKYLVHRKDENNENEK
jgi:hypothetical protein